MKIKITNRMLVTLILVFAPLHFSLASDVPIIDRYFPDRVSMRLGTSSDFKQSDILEDDKAYWITNSIKVRTFDHVVEGFLHFSEPVKVSRVYLNFIVENPFDNDIFVFLHYTDDTYKIFYPNGDNTTHVIKNPKPEVAMTSIHFKDSSAIRVEVKWNMVYATPLVIPR